MLRLPGPFLALLRRFADSLQQYQEIADKYPEDFQARDDDKYNYRYRGGESYRDVVIRLEPIIMELERSENIIIITYVALAYPSDHPPTRPLHN